MDSRHPVKGRHFERHASEAHTPAHKPAATDSRAVVSCFGCSSENQRADARDRRVLGQYQLPQEPRFFTDSYLEVAGQPFAASGRSASAPRIDSVILAMARA